MVDPNAASLNARMPKHLKQPQAFASPVFADMFEETRNPRNLYAKTRAARSRGQSQDRD
jgi:hypothetical protein